MRGMRAGKGGRHPEVLIFKNHHHHSPMIKIKINILRSHIGKNEWEGHAHCRKSRERQSYRNGPDRLSWPLMSTTEKTEVDRKH